MKKALSFLVLTLIPTLANSRPLFKTPKQNYTIYKSIQTDPNRVVALRADVTDKSIDPVIYALKRLDEKSHDPIALIINTRGGQIGSGERLIVAMESLKSPLTCFVEEKAFSMGAIIATYCPKLYIHKFAIVMFHEASYEVEGSETEIVVRVQAHEKFINALFLDISRKLNISFIDFRNLIHDEWWIDAKEAAMLGFSNGVVETLPQTLLPENYKFMIDEFQQIIPQLTPLTPPVDNR